MCLYPKKMVNKKYTVTAKNGGCIPPLPKNGSGEIDERVLYIEVPCGNCIECCSEKANEWRIRLGEELKVTEYPYFITLTFGPEELKKLCDKYNLGETNAIATIALRKFLERYRKEYKMSLKHWFITELGHNNTERIHMHGLILASNDISKHFEKIERQGNGWMCKFDFWKYGHVFLGDFCTQQTINYVTKYITKLDTDHKNFKGKILCSPGIGRSFLENSNNKLKYRYEKGNTRTYYTQENGTRIPLPVYYKNHMYNEQERENIWRDIMDNEESYVLGIRHSLNEKNDVLGRIEKRAQQTNTMLGYGDDSKEWRKQEYNVTLNMIRKGIKRENEIKAYKEGKGTYIPKSKRKYAWDKRENVL